MKLHLIACYIALSEFNDEYVDKQISWHLIMSRVFYQCWLFQTLIHRDFLEEKTSCYIKIDNVFFFLIGILKLSKG